MNRKKLTIAEQISDMNQKGITFHYTEEQDVSRFLKYNNYYFKLKSYGKNSHYYRQRRRSGQYSPGSDGDSHEDQLWFRDLSGRREPEPSGIL